MSNKYNVSAHASASGIGFFGLLTIVFIALKLLGVINWPWGLVLAPLWLPAAICVAIFFIVILIASIKR